MSCDDDWPPDRRQKYLVAAVLAVWLGLLARLAVSLVDHWRRIEGGK